MARSAIEKGLLMYDHNQASDFWLEYRSRLYWFEFDTVRFEKLLRDVEPEEDSEIDPTSWRRSAAPRAR